MRLDLRSSDLHHLSWELRFAAAASNNTYRRPGYCWDLLETLLPIYKRTRVFEPNYEGAGGGYDQGAGCGSGAGGGVVVRVEGAGDEDLFLEKAGWGGVAAEGRKLEGRGGELADLSRGLWEWEEGARRIWARL